MPVIKILTEKIAAKTNLLEDWFLQKFQETSAIFYNSIDLRHSGFKIAPIDTNCFPAGFNNLSDHSKIIAKNVAQNFLAKNFPDAKSILIIPENHTRNFRYLENILALQEILQTQQNTVLIGSVIENMPEDLTIDLENDKKITLQTVVKNGDKISLKNNFTPDLIIMNNDMTSGIPHALQDISTPIIPSTKLGWYQRTKSHHFTTYNNLAGEVAQILQIDPWLISSIHRSCHNVNFKENVGLQCLANYVEEVIASLKEKYQEHGVKESPYCYIKADNGTYGMAVMPVFSGEDLLEINKKERNKMNMLKESTQNTMVMIQEGIKTIDTIDNKICEPMIYMIGGQVVGNLFRTNDQRNQLESLNTTGMTFHDLQNLDDNRLMLGGSKTEISQVYKMLSMLAALATSREYA